MDNLKPCPFCGTSAVLEHTDLEKCRNRDNGDFLTRWKVKCPNCGITIDGGFTEYIFLKDETLKIMTPNFDGRKKAIEMWNRRAGNADH